jgi:gamma-glutamyltranspeptidase/glutathione hydrolase
MTFAIPPDISYDSRRSPVVVSSAAVASSQPLATTEGVSILRRGGTAADAAVAVAAMLQVSQPCSTGLGGDAFFLYYDAATRRVSAYNGSGRSSAGLTLDMAQAVAVDGELPPYHPYTVTVPGAADTWLAIHDRFGKLPLAEVLTPAIRHASDGFPVAPLTARWWNAGAQHQLSLWPHGHELTIDGRAPHPGERFRNPGLSSVLESLARDGREAFYRGWIADRIAAAVAEAGGALTTEDLARHAGEWVEPISIPYGDYTVWECPPNGQGLAALLALSIYSHLRPQSPEERLHAQVESMRLAFADAAAHVADPDTDPAPLDALLSPDYSRRRAEIVSLHRRADAVGPGIPPTMTGDDTVYFAVVDGDGNGCSFINSNFMGFGTGIVPEGCGFSLQNRGRGFTLTSGHPNVLAPSKRPYHTIIPALMTQSGSGALAAVLGVMGGMMQPQGHFQVVVSLCDDRKDPQAALDSARFQLADGDPNGDVWLEEPASPATVQGLTERGHRVETIGGYRRSSFGLGQIIASGDDGVWWCGSDPRGDGHAAGF